MTAGGLDYEKITPDFADVLLNDNTRRGSFTLTIIDDELFESEEELNLELRLDQLFPSQPSRVILSPNVSNVIILDNDGE